MLQAPLLGHDRASFLSLLQQPEPGSGIGLTTSGSSEKSKYMLLSLQQTPTSPYGPTSLTPAV